MKKRKMILMLVVIMSNIVLLSLSYADSSNEYIKIYNADGYVLDVTDGGAVNGTNIQLWTAYDENENQLFKLKDLGEYKYSFSAKNSGKCIDIYRGNSFDLPIQSGLNIDIWEDNNFEGQQFYFFSDDDKYLIASSANENLVLTSNGSYNGANVTLEEYNGSSSQHWTMKSVEYGDGNNDEQGDEKYIIARVYNTEESLNFSQILVLTLVLYLFWRILLKLK